MLLDSKGVNISEGIPEIYIGVCAVATLNVKNNLSSIFQYCRNPLAGTIGRCACQCKNKRFKSIERETSKHESEVKIKV